MSLLLLLLRWLLLLRHITPFILFRCGIPYQLLQFLNSSAQRLVLAFVLLQLGTTKGRFFKP